jgi:membrane protease YdiL (CAAX protease family)
VTGISARARVRLPDRVATGLTIAALAGLAVGGHVLAAPWWLGPVEAAALLVWARLCGLSWAQLGLGRDRLASGMRWGLGAISVVAAVYLVGVLVPLARPLFQDSRYHVAPGRALFTALVVIPLGTVVLEEIAFRSVLWGMLARHSRTWQVLATTSVLFGLWHVLSSLSLSSANAGVGGTIGRAGTALVVVATVAFTALGGAVFGELRRRSGSVLASAGAHWATNALGVLFGLLAWSLAGRA